MPQAVMAQGFSERITLDLWFLKCHGSFFDRGESRQKTGSGFLSLRRGANGRHAKKTCGMKACATGARTRKNNKRVSDEDIIGSLIGGAVFGNCARALEDGIVESPSKRTWA